MTTAKAQGAKLPQLRAAVSLARVMREGGRAAQVRKLLLPLWTDFAEGFDTPDLREARTLLRG